MHEYEHCECCECVEKRCRQDEHCTAEALVSLAESAAIIADAVKRWVDFQIKPVGVVVDEGKATSH